MVIFISRNVYDNKWYLVGFYGKGEYHSSQFATGKKLSSLIPEDIKKDLRERLRRNEIQKYQDYVEGIINADTEYKGLFRSEKKYSAIFVPEGYVEITPDEIGVRKIGMMSFTYIDIEKVDKIHHLLLKAKQKHEELLQKVSDDSKEEIRGIIKKIEYVRESASVERIKTALLSGKEKYGEYWKENSKNVLRVYRKFVDKVIDGEDPRVLEYELQNKHKEILKTYRDIDKLFWYIFGVKGANKALDDENVEKFREFLKKSKTQKRKMRLGAYLNNIKTPLKV